jgi:peptidoglycan/xylan/chitin deacetylase (PgdA/CDA1 family)
LPVFGKSRPASSHARFETGSVAQSTSAVLPAEFEAGNSSPSWRELVEGASYYTGVLHVWEKLSRSWELGVPPQGGFPHLRRVSADKFAILCYHRVGTQGIPYHSSLAPESFKHQMRYLREKYRILSLSQLCEELEFPSSRGPAVVVTFDDGYRDLYTHAFPVLKKYQIPATIYLAVNSIETGEVAWYDRIFLALQVYPEKSLEIVLGHPRRYLLDSRPARLWAAMKIVSLLRQIPDDARNHFCSDFEKRVSLPRAELADRMLTWEQVQEMAQAGIFFGSHTLSHPVVSRLTLTKAERELRESRCILERRLGHPILDFAFPFGQEADCGSVQALVARCGYRSAVTTRWGINTAGVNRFALRRVQLGEEQSLPSFAFQLNQLFFCVEEDSLMSDSAAARFDDTELSVTSSDLSGDR